MQPQCLRTFERQAAKEAVFECPYLLTKNSKLMRATLPALINVLGHKAAENTMRPAGAKGLLTESILDIQGSRSRLREVIAKYPQLTNLPVGDFYKVR